MMTAMLTAKNILAGERKYDVWAVNQDAEYHEAGAAGEKAADVESRIPIGTGPAAGLSRLNVPTGVETGQAGAVAEDR